MSSMEMSSLSRRRFLINAGVASAGVLVSRRYLFAQAAQVAQSAETGTQPDYLAQARAAAATAKITTQKLRGPVSVMMGSGGNIAVLAGSDGKLIVDSGYSTSRPQVLEAMNGVSADPLKFLVNTHWHFDHVDGNDWMHTAGATIVAHENTRKRMSTPQYIAAFHLHLPPAPAGAIPTKVFADTYAMKLNGEQILLSHYAPAHTDTDLAVQFPGADVVHVGDTWFNGFYPFIDYSSGGGIDGMIVAAGRSLGLASATTIIIPGHGPVGDKAGLTGYREMLVGVREKVAGLKKQGRSLEETLAAKPTADYDAKWGGGFLKPEQFVGLVYQGV